MGGNQLRTAPGQLRQSSIWRGPGRTSLLKLASPAAGAQFTRPTPGDYWERILAIAFQFTTGATVANRSAILQYMDGDGFTFAQVPILNDFTANQVWSAYLDRTAYSPVNQATTQSTYGTVTTPGAGAVIVQLANLLPGEYQIEWVVELQGTPAAGTDNDNMAVNLSGTQKARSVNPAAVGTYPQEPINLDVQSGNTLNIAAIAAATAGAIYSGTLTVVPLQLGGLQGELPDFVMKSGWQIQVTVANMQATDQISNVAMLVERWPSSDADQYPHDPVRELFEMIMALGQ